MSENLCEGPTFVPNRAALIWLKSRPRAQWWC